MDHTYRLARSMTEVSMSKKVIILDMHGKEVRNGTYSSIRDEWKDLEAFYKRLREMINKDLVYIK